MMVSALCVVFLPTCAGYGCESNEHMEQATNGFTVPLCVFLAHCVLRVVGGENT